MKVSLLLVPLIGAHVSQQVHHILVLLCIRQFRQLQKKRREGKRRGEREGKKREKKRERERKRERKRVAQRSVKRVRGTEERRRVAEGGRVRGGETVYPYHHPEYLVT